MVESRTERFRKSINSLSPIDGGGGDNLLLDEDASANSGFSGSGWSVSDADAVASANAAAAAVDSVA